jgi:hypothetical protein
MFIARPIYKPSPSSVGAKHNHATLELMKPNSARYHKHSIPPGFEAARLCEKNKILQTCYTEFRSAAQAALGDLWIIIDS